MATENDRAVLEAVFNPLFSEFGFSADADDDGAAQTENTAQDDGTANKVKELEVEGVQAAEKGDIDRAIDIFTEVIRLAPNRASGYNNRAQALRIKGQVERALEDLNNAINLGHSSKHAAAQAFCQRGLIHRLRQQDQEAEADFKEAAKLGSQFAKNQLVQMNPYAALCNRMLGQMFAKIRQGEDDSR
ncbi:tetratricopeptide repeat protein 36 homolog [Amblyomma americanum]|uniref:Tetratricopeptide repeat protein n=2 Tax=Amblyomma americanum TaxID=6943 RepID=A0AAQ4EK63_AMBAM